MLTKKQYYRVAACAEVPAESGITVFAGAQRIALFHRAGVFYALDDHCPHRGGALGPGILADEKVLCPLHCFDFNLKTGECGQVPALRAQTYELKVENGDIYVLC